jgi:hypothetical protein
MTDTGKTTKKQSGFQKGKSGNPLGRPQGSLVTAVTDTPPKITSENNVGKTEEQKCAQCLGRIDGTDCARTIGDHKVWLHPECEPFWADGNGWGVRR